MLEKVKHIGVHSLTTTIEGRYLSVSFHAPAGSSEGLEHSLDGAAAAPPADARASAPEPKRDLMTPADEFAAEEIRRAQLMMDDPVAFEQEMVASSLEEIRQHAESESRGAE